MNVSTSAVRTFAGIVGFSLFLSWPYCAFSMSSLFVFDTHGGELNNACWVVSLLFVSATLFGCLQARLPRAPASSPTRLPMRSSSSAEPFPDCRVPSR